MEVSAGFLVNYEELDGFDGPNVSRESIEQLSAESGLPLKKCFRLLRNSYGDINVAREWIDKDRLLYESSRKRSKEVRKVLRAKLARYKAMQVDVVPPRVLYGDSPVDLNVYLREFACGVGRDNGDGSRTLNVWFTPAYQNDARWVECRVDRHGVWRIVGGNYIPEPKVDGNGRLNGSI